MSNDLAPSSRTAYSASATACAGVFIGISAPTVQRSRYGANMRAWARFTARHNTDDSSSSVSSK